MAAYVRQKKKDEAAAVIEAEKAKVTAVPKRRTRKIDNIQEEGTEIETPMIPLSSWPFPSSSRGYHIKVS